MDDFAELLLHHWQSVLAVAGFAMIVRALIRDWMPKLFPYVEAALKGVAMGIIFLVFLAFLQQIEVREGLQHDMTAAREEIADVRDRQSQVLKKLADQRPTRPFFTLQTSTVEPFLPTHHVASVVVKNNANPATAVVSQLLVMKAGLNAKDRPLLKGTPISEANNIGPQGQVVRYWGVPVSDLASPAFLVLYLRYQDALTMKPYPVQTFYLKFLGQFSDGKYLSRLMSANQEEKARIETYIATQKITTLSQETTS